MAGPSTATKREADMRGDRNMAIGVTPDRLLDVLRDTIIGTVRREACC